MADAYKLKADASLPQAIREADELVDGQKIYETIGRNYAAGDYVLASDITPPLRERAENGDLDHLLEAVSLEEAQENLNRVETRVEIPEHEAERVVLEDAGAQIVPREQVLDLKSAGAEAASANLEAAKSDGVDERPNLTAPETPQVNHEQAAVATGEDSVDEEKLVGVEQPPGHIVGPDLEAAEGDGEVKPKKRGRPRKSEQKADDSKQEKSE